MAQLILNPLAVLPDARRILAIRLGAMGDVVRTLPAVALLRDHAREASIDWLVEERTAPIVEARSFIDEAVVFPRAEIVGLARSGGAIAAAARFAVFARELRARRYDLVLDFHAIARSSLLAALTGARHRVSYARPLAREGAGALATHRVRLVCERVSRFERNEALVRALVGPEAVRSRPPLDVLPAAREAMEKALALPLASRAGPGSGAGPGPAPVVLHAGSSAAASHKRWPVERFAELARLLRSDEHEGARVLVAFGPDPAELSRARAIVDASQGAAELAPATPGFEDLAALLGAARVLVAADSGPLHTASLVGTPVVQLVGPTDPVENEPWRETPSRRVVTDLECRGCRRGCAAAACMQGIEARAVLAALQSLRPPRRAPLRSLPAVGVAAPSIGS